MVEDAVILTGGSKWQPKTNEYQYKMIREMSLFLNAYPLVYMAMISLYESSFSERSGAV